MKIQIQTLTFISRYKCVDSWSKPIVVDDKTSEYGDMIQFYKGGYPYRAIPKNEYRIIK